MRGSTAIATATSSSALPHLSAPPLPPLADAATLRARIRTIFRDEYTAKVSILVDFIVPNRVTPFAAQHGYFAPSDDDGPYGTASESAPVSAALDAKLATGVPGGLRAELRRELAGLKGKTRPRY